MCQRRGHWRSQRPQAIPRALSSGQRPLEWPADLVDRAGSTWIFRIFLLHEFITIRYCLDVFGVDWDFGPHGFRLHIFVQMHHSSRGKFLGLTTLANLNPDRNPAKGHESHMKSTVRSMSHLQFCNDGIQALKMPGEVGRNAHPQSWRRQPHSHRCHHIESNPRMPCQKGMEWKERNALSVSSTNSEDVLGSFHSSSRQIGAGQVEGTLVLRPCSDVQTIETRPMQGMKKAIWLETKIPSWFQLRNANAFNQSESCSRCWAFTLSFNDPDSGIGLQAFPPLQCRTYLLQMHSIVHWDWAILVEERSCSHPGQNSPLTSVRPLDSGFPMRSFSVRRDPKVKRSNDQKLEAAASLFNSISWNFLRQQSSGFDGCQPHTGNISFSNRQRGSRPSSGWPALGLSR